MSDTTPDPDSGELAKLLTDWIKADTWEQSQEILATNAERLLSDKALEDLNGLLLEDVGDENATKILLKHKSILETARSASIDAAYAELLKPSPLEIALQALPDKLHEPIQAMMAANNLDELLQQIQQHLVLLTPEAATAIEQLIDNLRQADQENIVQAIEERYEILKQAVLANRPIDEDLAQLLVNWINADTWEESQEMLAANAEQLLSNDAIETLTKLLVLDTREDKEEEEKRARTILQHLAILELALAESIYAAYAELLEPSPLALALEALPGDLREALQAMMAVNSPAELLEQIQQHPVLLTEQAIGAIDNLLNDLRQVDQEDVVAHIEARYETLKQVIEVEYSPLNVALKALPEELCAAIQAMIEVKSSTELLEQISQHPILLTEQATGAIDKLLNDLRQADQEDVVDHIEARYEILKQVIGEERDPHRAVLNALLNANTPGKLQQTIAEYPMLLDDESLNALSERINQVEQGGNTITAERLRFRLGEVHRIQQQRKQAAHTGDTNTPGRDYDAPGQTVISSEKNSIAIGGGNSGNINQTNIESYTLPVKHWQPPKRQSLPKTFVGRQKELQELREYLLAGEGVAISGRGATMLQGMGGIGKTYLAIQLSVELQGHFPGGVIRIDLGPLVTNAERAQVQLRRLATYAFGGNQPEIVGQLQPEQVAAWLQETSPGRLLVIFDDVWEQEPLLFLEQALPADAVRIVTTRDANIAQALGGKRISLDRLSAEDGLALLKDRLGCQGNAAYRTVLEKLVELLGGHALALDIAASLIKTPRRIQAILGDLQQGIGLGTLDGLRLPRGETRDTNLEKSLALSYERMLPEEQSRFRALGVFAAETPISAEAAAAIWNMDDLNTAQKALFELTDLSLLDEFEDAMGIIYRQHSLLHTYAYALLDKAGELNSASWAHAEYYRAMALRAETTTPRDYPLLDRHMQNLLAALLWTDKHESVLFSQLVEVLFQFLQLRGQSELLEVYLPKAAAAASATGNIGREANLLKSLGDLESRLGNLDQARAHYDAALPLFQVERDRLGEANVYMSLGYMFLAQEERTQAKTHYERALPLYIAERDPLGQANILIELGRLRFESGNHEQGMKDVQQAAMLFHSIQSEEWAQRAEQYLSAMRAQLEHREANSEPSLTGEGQLLEAFINVESSQAMFELVQQNPQLLTGEWFTTIEELIAVQTDEPAKRHISERLDALKQIKHGVEQQVSASSEVMRVLLDFSVADWAKRRQLLDEHSALLLNEQVEAALNVLLEVNKEPGAIAAIEQLRTVLRRCRTWSIEAVWYFELYMRLGDSIAISAEYEDAIMNIAALLLRRTEDNTALEQAVKAMQELLSSLAVDTPGLFRAALLRDLADTMEALPTGHPLRKVKQMEAYYREALPLYQAADRPISVAFIQRSLGNLLSEQGRYEEACGPLQAAVQGLRAQEEMRENAAWALSSYASVLDQLGRLEEALAAYSEAMTLLPGSPLLLRNRAETLIHVRRLEEAETDLARAVELDGNEDSSYLWYRRAQLAIARGDSELAEKMLDEVTARDATFDLALVRAQSAWLRGDLDAAQKELQKVLEQANAGDRVSIQRNMLLLFDEHPGLAGRDALLAIIMKFDV